MIDPPRHHLSQLRSGFAVSHAARIKHAAIRNDKTSGIAKKYLQLSTVMATKHSAKAHATGRSLARVSAATPPSCHANAAANSRNTVTNKPNPTKKSQ